MRRLASDFRVFKLTRPFVSLSLSLSLHPHPLLVAGIIIPRRRDVVSA